MSRTETLDAPPARALRDTAAPPPVEPVSEDGRLVSEREYWRDYYEHPDFSYEWNNGRLEEKPVSDYETYCVYAWLWEVIRRYLATHPVGKLVALEMGFRLALPTGTVIRKPDFAVVRNDNPRPLRARAKSYAGVFDLCCEALSDGSPTDIRRDAVTKKAEYATGGVAEYYILHPEPEYQAFYQRTPAGVYVPIAPDGGVIASRVLPGLRFRISDLHARRDLELLRDDPVYSDFVLPGWRADRERAVVAEQRAAAAEARAAAEASARVAAEARAQALAERLAQLAARPDVGPTNDDGA